MKTTVEKLSSNEVKISFVVEDEIMQKHIMNAYNSLKGRVNIPGFRRGHAPKKVIEMHYGKDFFNSDAFESLFNEVYPQAVRENNIEVVDQPKVDDVKIELGEPVEFAVKVFVRPDVELGKYKGVEASRQEVEVTEDDVKAELERARENVARFIEIDDRPVKLDDQVDIDYEGYCEGEQFEGGTAKNQKLVIGSESFIPGFEDQLIGKNLGDEVEVNVTFPEKYHAENLAGKPAVFKVKINEINEKELPALDDEFAKDVSDCDTLDEYKAQIREKLETEANRRSDEAFENEVISEAVDASKVDIPEAMIEDRIDNMVRELGLRMSRQGVDMQNYMKMTGMSVEQLRSIYRERAESEVKTELVIDAIRKAEGIEATEEEINEEIEREAKEMGKTVEEFNKMYGDGIKEYLKHSVATKKTLDMLKSEAVPETATDDDSKE